MRRLNRDILVMNMVLAVAVLALASPSNAQYVITEIIDATGDGGGNVLESPDGVAVDSIGNVYVVGYSNDNAFKITPGGTITEIIDVTGDRGGNTLEGPRQVAVDSSGSVYVSGIISSNVFKIATPGTCSTGGTPCTITEIIDATMISVIFHQAALDGEANASAATASITSNKRMSRIGFRIAIPSRASRLGV